eukprot:GHUV01010961.1.p1 GENE.GHUV01010961.1~~GHUV01010961.1.p1  ORF type:complete len:461 (+),score=214.24 GHUV01010961.1:460-1842(+)
MSDKAVDLAQLRHRLAKLGVHISEPSSSEDVVSNKPDASWESHLERNSKEVAQLLERCNKVHQALCRADEDDEQQASTAAGDASRKSAVAAAAAAVKAAKSATAAAATLSKASPGRPSASAPGQSSSTGRALSAAAAGSAAAKAHNASATAAPGRAGSSKVLVRAAQKLLHDAQAQAQQVDRALTITAAAGSAAHRAAASSAADDHRNSPLGTVLAQYKEAQAAWAQEKARLRRDAVASRKKASKLEIDLAKLQRLHEHKSLDVSTLKAALKGRDQSLDEAHAKIRQLEEALAKSNEVAAEKLCSMAAERDDLQALLLATLERLEGVEAVVAAADATSAAMEDKVRVLEGERMAALEAAAAARAEVSQLKEEQRSLHWQSQLLEKMSEVQLRHNKRKSAAIKDLLTKAAAGEVDAVTAAASGGRGSGKQRSAGAPSAVLQDVLDELLQAGGDDSDGDDSS